MAKGEDWIVRALPTEEEINIAHGKAALAYAKERHREGAAQETPAEHPQLAGKIHQFADALKRAGVDLSCVLVSMDVESFANFAKAMGYLDEDGEGGLMIAGMLIHGDSGGD